MKAWQKIKDRCEFSVDRPKQGFWCKKGDHKCYYKNCTMTSASDGTMENPKSEVSSRGGLHATTIFNGSLTERQIEVVRLSNEGLSSSLIGKKLGISRQAVEKLLFKANAKIGVANPKKGVASERRGVARTRKDSPTHKLQLHNDNIAFDIYPINVTRIAGKLVQLKHVSYRQFTTDDYALKFYPQKLIIQFRNDIEGDSVEEVKAKADQRLSQFMSTFSFNGIQFRNKGEQLQRHYAILGTKIAKKYANEGRKLLILDRWDGKQRIVVDLSDGHHKPHFEGTHPTKGEFDADRWHHIIEDGTHNDIDLLSITKFKVDKAMEMVSIFAEQQGAYANEIKAHREAIKELGSGIKEMTSVMMQIKKFIKSKR